MDWSIFSQVLFSPKIILNIISILLTLSIYRSFLSISEEHEKEISKIKEKLSID